MTNIDSSAINFQFSVWLTWRSFHFRPQGGIFFDIDLRFLEEGQSTTGDIVSEEGEVNIGNITFVKQNIIILLTRWRAPEKS